MTTLSCRASFSLLQIAVFLFLVQLVVVRTEDIIKQGPICECVNSQGGTGSFDLCKNKERCVVSAIATVELCKDLVASWCKCTCNIPGDLFFDVGSRIKCFSPLLLQETICDLRLFVDGDVVLKQDAIVSVSSLIIESQKGNVKLLGGSVINATGQGLFHRSQARANLIGNGGSYGGLGGQSSCEASSKDTNSVMIGSPSAPWEGWLENNKDNKMSEKGYGYGGTGRSMYLAGKGAGRGGGRVFLKAKVNVTLNGRILANGIPAEPGCEQDCGSGAGGTIVINATWIRGNASQQQNVGTGIVANGGDSLRDDAGAGGGGRLALVTENPIDLAGPFEIGATGGDAIRGKDPLCKSGAAGTILRAYYAHSVGSYVGTIEVNNCVASIPCMKKDFVEPHTLLEIPRVNNSKSFEESSNNELLILAVQINKYAVVNSSVISLAKLDIDAGDLFSLGIYLNTGKLKATKYVQAQSVELSSGSVIEGDRTTTLDVFNGTFHVDASSKCALLGNFTVNVLNGSSSISGLMENDPRTTSNSQSLNIFSSKGVKINKGASIKTERLIIIANEKVVINSKIGATVEPECTAVLSRRLCYDILKPNITNSTRNSPKDWLPDELSDYSLALIVRGEIRGRGNASNSINGTIVVEENGLVQGRSIMLCSEIMSISGIVTTSGQGCLSDTGFGLGCSSSGSSGGGGGHGGHGGNGSGCTNGGEVYDSAQLPILSGSGGGSGLSGTSGGSGGGVVVLGASQYMVLGKDAEISADGTSGQDSSAEKSGGGGGSGGAIVLNSPIICASKNDNSYSKKSSRGAYQYRASESGDEKDFCRISAVGGNGGKGEGGGGGGGRIAMTYKLGQPNLQVPKGANVSGCTLWGNFSGVDVKVTGGRADEKQIRDTSRYSGNNHSGHGENGTVASPPCSPGRGGIWCDTCPLGYYKSTYGSYPCAPCDAKPCISKSTCSWMVRGATTSECPIICTPGHVLPDCVTPLEQLIINLGGVYVFVGIVGGFTLAILLLFCCVCTQLKWCPGYYSNKERLSTQRSRTLRALKRHRERIGLGRNLTDSYLYQMPPLSEEDDYQEDDGAEDLLSQPLLGLGMGIQRNIGSTHLGAKTHIMTEPDIPYHVTRIYFGGDNNAKRPWFLSVEPPEKVKPLVEGEEYKKMVSRINTLASISFSMKFLCNSLLLACYPIGEAFARYYRTRRALRLREFFEKYDYACIRSTRGQALKTLKFNYDKSATLAYLDVLQDRPIAVSRHLVPLGKRPIVNRHYHEDANTERFPMVLLLAGNGTYWSRYLLDTEDILVRAVPHLGELRTFIDQQWVDMVAALNALLRKVQRVNVVHAIQPALELLKKYNANPDKLGGLQVNLGVFWPNDGEFKLGLVLTYDDLYSHQLLSSSQIYDESEAVSSDDIESNLVDECSKENGIKETVTVASLPSIAEDAMDMNIIAEHSRIQNLKGTDINQSKHIGLSPSKRFLVDELMTNEEQLAAEAAVVAFEEEERNRKKLEKSLPGNTNKSSSIISSVSMASVSLTSTDRVSSDSVSMSLNTLDKFPLAMENNGIHSQNTGSSIRDEALLISSSPLSQRQVTPGGRFRPVERRVSTTSDATSMLNFTIGGSVDGETDTQSSEDGIDWLPYPGRIMTYHGRNWRSRSGKDFHLTRTDSGIADSNINGGDSVEPTAPISSLREFLGILINRVPAKGGSQLMLRGLVSLLVFLDILTTFLMLTSLWCIEIAHECNAIGFWLTNSLYPFATVVSPALGVTFLAFPFSGLGRTFAAWNVLSIVNTLIAFTVTSIFRDQLSIVTVFLAGIWLCLKCLEGNLIDKYIALVETDRGWRKRKQ